LKSIPRATPPPVLLLARSPDRARHAFALQSGAADLLPKPLPPGMLEEKAWELLRRRGFVRPGEPGGTPREKAPAPRPAARTRDRSKSRH
ncbi:MAG: hypothetical protein KJ062_22455, partial [Thermoanaerobaculia bacterium]|nr:hypothetical protein [Thermoanaerobaculia bacterium]